MTKRELSQQLSEVRNDQAKGKSLRDILAIDDRERFMLVLEHYVAPPGTLVGAGWDALLVLDVEPRLILVLNCLASAMFSSGVAKFLTEARVLFEESLAGCALVGASRAVSFLTRVRESFPGGVLPASAEECGDIILDDGTGVGRSLRSLDGEFVDAYGEIIDRLREYINENIERFSRIGK